MADIELLIKIDTEYLKDIKECVECGDINYEPWVAIANGTPLPKGHGKLVDISKIDEDRIDDDNPIIYLTINGEYTEAVSLDYINNLSTIVEADTESEDIRYDSNTVN